MVQNSLYRRANKCCFFIVIIIIIIIIIINIVINDIALIKNVVQSE